MYLKTLLSILLIGFFQAIAQDLLVVETLYGPLHIHEPLIKDIVETPSFERLSGIHQYGIFDKIMQHCKPYSRKDHSLGVLWLLDHYGASILEQVVGAWHDISHTVFSHAGDFLSKSAEEFASYQDDIHTWFLEQTECAALLARYNLTPAMVNPKSGCFRLHERDLPNICADRLEYVLHGGWLEGLFSQEMIHAILDHLMVENKEWVFTDQRHARIFADAALFLSEHVFGSAYNYITYAWTAHALQHALDINLITMRHIHFSNDAFVWDRLATCADPIISLLVHNLMHAHERYAISSPDAYDLHARSKFRGIDPWVKIDGHIMRLTNLDQEFKESFYASKERMAQGIYIKIVP